MVAGQPCRRKDCDQIQPCTLHTSRGKDRKEPLQIDKGPNVVDMFTKRRQEQEKRSQDPRPRKGSVDRVRVTLGERYSQLVHDIADGLTTWKEVAQEMDAQELARGQFRASDGSFKGAPPKLVPMAFYHACTNEMMQRFDQTLRENLQKAVEEMVALGMDDEVEASTRFKVLQYVMERVVGKVPDKIEVRQADPWEQVISDILAEADDEAIQEPRYMKERSGEQPPET